MAMIVKNNMGAIRSLNTLNRNQSELTKSLEKVSSGMKVNSAKDDASAYAISERMRTQIRALNQAEQNTQNASSLLKTAEGAVSSTVEILKTMKEKSINAATDTNTDSDRQTIQKEIDQFIDQIDDNALTTFNGKYLLDGSTLDYENKSLINSTCNITLEDLFSDEEIESINAAVASSSSSSSSVKSSAVNTILKGLNTEWMNQALLLVTNSFGLSFTESGRTVNAMNVNLVNKNNGVLASVTNTYSASTGKTSKLSLTINMKYYNAISSTNVNGYSSTASSVYLDRALAHELTHAVMAANINFFSSLPLYVREGAAELVHGVDDTRSATMYKLLKNPTTLSNVLNKKSAQNTGDNAYAAGYMILRYMAKQGATKTKTSQLNVIKKFMNYLDKYGGKSSALNSAINYATGGKFKTEAALISSFVNDVKKAKITTNTKASNFLKTYCGINLSNTDTGAITGKDAGGSSIKTKISIVPESKAASKWTFPTSSSKYVRGLTVKWPTSYLTSSSSNMLNALLEGDSSYSVDDSGKKIYDDWYDFVKYHEEETPNFDMEITGMGLRFHVGAGAGQSINVGFYDMRAKALGLVDDDGNKVSVVTRDNALNAIETFQTALDIALEQQTTIGALEARLEYTSSNLITSVENVQAAESTMRDADMAKEMTNFTKANVLMQAAQSMLAQANQNSSAVLSLLQ